MAKIIKTGLVSRIISRITAHITYFGTHCLLYGFWGGRKPSNFRSLQPAAAENAFSRDGIRLLQKGLRRAQLQVLTPPGKVRGFKSGRRPKMSPGAPSLSAAFAENRKHRKLRGSLRSECQVPFSGVRLRKNTVKYGVVSDLSAKSPS